MEVEYFYCNSCGFEDSDIFVEFSRAVANGDVCLCPECNEEVLIDED